MTDEKQRLLSDLDDVRHALHELLTAVEISFSVQGGNVSAECLHNVVLRELDRVCDALMPR